MVIRADQLAALLGCPSAGSARRLASQPGFPPAVELSPGRRGWVLAEVEEWIEQRKVYRPLSLADVAIPESLQQAGPRGQRRGPVRRAA